MEKLLGTIPIKFEYAATLLTALIPTVGTLIWGIITTK